MLRILLILGLIFGQIQLKAQKEKTYYSSGKLKCVFKRKNGEYHGMYKCYHENGQLQGTGQWNKGDKIGEWITYYENGKIEEIKNFTTDGGSFFEKKNGVYKKYFENGLLEESGSYINNKKSGFWEYYEIDSKTKKYRMKEKGNYINGEKEGRWQTFDDEGKRHTIYVYKKGQKVLEIKHGKYVEYEWISKGVVEMKYIDHYDNGDLRKRYLIKYFEKDGKKYWRKYILETYSDGKLITSKKL